MTVQLHSIEGQKWETDSYPPMDDEGGSEYFDQVPPEWQQAVYSQQKKPEILLQLIEQRDEMNRSRDELEVAGRACFGRDYSDGFHH